MKKLIALIGVMALLLFGCVSQQQLNESLKHKAVIYKTSSCGCCKVYASYISGKGIQTEINTVSSLNSIHEEQGIPYSLTSCHTVLIGGYFVEGHIPVEAIEKLLAEKPDIKGIAMPGMPSGSPGMPGAKEEFIIYSVGKDGSINEFMRI